ncbi:hypothetical protein EBR57_01865 [bacterium]|nr:hypothetical protein [bacterium]
MTPHSLFEKNRRFLILVPGLLLGVLAIAFSVHRFENPKSGTAKSNKQVATANTAEHALMPQPKHIAPPAAIKAIYMTSWVASVKPWREQLIKFINESEINALVIDVKDYSGYISFETNDPKLAELGVEDIRIKDLREFIEMAHQNGIYVIARITVFQDPMYAKLYPAHAVQTQSGTTWTDRNGLSYIDPGSRDFWDYIVRIGTAAAYAGFDELNFDYIRFPTDGNMKDAVFPISGARLSKGNLATSTSATVGSQKPTASSGVSIRRQTVKEAIITEFFAYLRQQTKPLGIPISADLFGMTMTAQDDVNIGQYLESAAQYFDYICPMVYPSHYPPQFNGYGNPAEHPYEIVHYAMTRGAARMTAIGQDPKKLRPWLQDFNLGATYDAAKVRAQIKATYDSKLVSWLIWDPRNKYTRQAYLPATVSTTTANAY